MSEEQKLIPNFDKAIFKKDDGTDLKFKTIKRKNKKGEIIEYIYEDKYNKESQHTRSQKYYENHKEDINKKISCDICKNLISKSNIAKHNATKKHLKNVEINNII